MSSADSRTVRAIIAQGVASLALWLVAAAPASAQAPQRAAVTLLGAIHLVAAEPGDGSAVALEAPVLGQLPRQPSVFVVPTVSRDRPRLLLPLYGTFGVLQALDAHSTLRAVRGGAVEVNPLLAPIGNNPGALVAVKVATTAGTIVLAEKLWRRHPVGAVVLMAAVNAAYGAIVAANYRR